MILQTALPPCRTLVERDSNSLSPVETMVEIVVAFHQWNTMVEIVVAFHQWNTMIEIVVAFSSGCLSPVEHNG